MILRGRSAWNPSERIYSGVWATCGLCVLFHQPQIYIVYRVVFGTRLEGPSLSLRWFLPQWPHIFRPHIIQTFERLRCHLKRLNDGENPGPRPPVLQYVILLDLSSLSFRDFVRWIPFRGLNSIPDWGNQNIELLSWTLREIVPRFPGMLAGGKWIVSSISGGRIRSLYKPYLQFLCSIIHGLMLDYGI